MTHYFQILDTYLAINLYLKHVPPGGKFLMLYKIPLCLLCTLESPLFYMNPSLVITNPFEDALLTFNRFFWCYFYWPYSLLKNLILDQSLIQAHKCLFKWLQVNCQTSLNRTLFSQISLSSRYIRVHIYIHSYFYIFFTNQFILSAIYPCIIGLKALYNQPDCTSTAPTLKLLTFP